MASSISAGTTSSTALVCTADTTGALQLATNNGTVAVTVDTSQNVGIGTTSPSQKLQVANGNIYISTTNYLMWNSGGSYAIDSDASTRLSFYSGSGTERMRIDSSGNVGIGTTSPNAKLEIKAASASQRQLQLTHFNSTDGWYFTADDTGGVLKTSRAGSSGLNGEAMRIDSSGNLIVNSTATIGTGGKSQVTSAADTFYAQSTATTAFAATIFNVTNTSARLTAYQYGSGGSPTNVGTVTTNGTGVTYGTSSDYRLKEDIAPMTGALSKVAQLKPVTYKWKSNGSDGQGFIAHELQEIVPDAVQGEKDAVDANGNPEYQGIDTSFLVATLTAAIQELTAKVTALEAKVGASA